MVGVCNSNLLYVIQIVATCQSDLEAPPELLGWAGGWPIRCFGWQSGALCSLSVASKTSGILQMRLGDRAMVPDSTNMYQQSASYSDPYNLLIFAVLRGMDQWMINASDGISQMMLRDHLQRQLASHYFTGMIKNHGALPHWPHLGFETSDPDMTWT